MDSLIQMDDLSGLVAPDISTDTPEWCENCQVLRQEIKKLQDEQEQSFVKLKQKIISTDLLIKKYKSKCEDYDVQYKKNEESTKRADKFQRQSEILETQLKATLMEAEPLRNVKASMETEIKQKNSEIVELRNRTIVAEGAQRQYEHLTKTSTAEIEKLEAEKRDLTARIKVLEGGKISKETAKELKGEISMLKKENTGLKKNEKRLERRLKSALSKIEELTEKVKEWRAMPAERRRRRGSGTFLSPLRSPSKSPRVSKVSPKSSPKKNSPKLSPKPPARAIAMNLKPAETEDSDSNNSDDSNNNDDDDDDTTSLYRLTFSPLMPCLSPLSPSPACFKQSQRGMSHLAAQHSEEENLSDMADDLEQQLFGDLMDDDSKDNTDTVVNQSTKTMEEHTALSSSDESVEEDELDKTKCKNDAVVADELDNGEESGGQFLLQENSTTATAAAAETTTTKYVVEARNKETGKETSSLCDKKSETVKENEIIVNKNRSSDNDKSKQISEVDKDKNVSSDSINDNIIDGEKSKSEKIDSDKNVSAFDIDKTNDNRSVKERLASSIEILSPTATRKTRDSMKAKTRCKNEITSPPRTREPHNISKNISKNMSQENKSAPDNHEEKEVDSLSSEPLARNDTTKFEPVLTEHDTEKDGHSKIKKSQDLPESIDDAKNISHSAKENSAVVPKTGDESKLTDSVSERVENVANKSDSMSNKEIKCVDSDQNKTVSDSECEIKVDIIEETEPVGALHKTPPSRAYLTRQQCVNTKKIDKNLDSRQKPTSHESKGDATESSKSSKRSTQKSPKSSPGVFEEDLDLFQDTEAYIVLQRETPQRSNADSRKLRSITKALRNSFKFKDRDSIDSTVHHREQKNITTAFIKHDNRIENNQKGGKVCDKEVDNASIHNDRMKPQKPPPSGSVSEITPSAEPGHQKIGISDSDSNNKVTCQGTSHEKALKSTEQSFNVKSNVPEDHKENRVSSDAKSSERRVKESEGSTENKDTTDISASGQNVKSDSKIVDTQKSAEENNALAPDNIDEGKSVISPSRQLSTGFVVNSSLERTPSTDSQTSNVELVSAICDREVTRSPRSRSPMRPRSPLTRQKNVTCDTIAEESELELGAVNDKQQDNEHIDRSSGRDDKHQSETSGSMILGIDDLFAHQEDYDHSESVDDNSDIPDQALLFGSKQEGTDNKAEGTDKVADCKSRNDVKNVVKTEYGICNDDSSVLNKDNVTENVNLEGSTTHTSDVRESSSTVDTNKPGCSYHHDESFHSSLDQSSNEGENIAVTSTSSLMTSSRLLTCTPDNIDNELVTVSHSRSRSTTPSICSIGTATPPLSPLSISPFDFITPISPLPPSPVRQVDRVSPLSPEIVNEVSNDAQIETEQHASNENEQNVGNVPPGIVTPDKNVLNKVIAHSPIHIPDLISPIKTPKQRPDRKIKDEKGKKGKIKSEKDRNKPITFVSSVPMGVLTVKPKQESQTTNTNSKTGVSAIDRPSNRDINLRKHLALKKSVDISSNSDSVFTRKSGHTVSRPKSRSDSINEQTPTPVKKTSNEVKKDVPTETLLTKDESSLGNELKMVPSVDETGDAKVITVDTCVNQCNLGNKKDSVNITENNNAENNAKKIKCENSINEVKDTNRLAKLSHSVKTCQENDHVTKDTHVKNQENVPAKENVAVTSKGDNKSSISKSVMSNIDLRKRTLKHQQFTRAKMSKVDLPSERKVTDEQQDVSRDIKADGTKIDREHQAPAKPISQSISEPISEVNEDHKPSKPEPDEQPAGYDPLMASKRKTRMAHQPRSHPLVVRKPPVIIEPTYQPKALQPKSSQRKRKSLDSSDKDSAPSKKAKGPMFHQRPKADKKVDPERQERIRKMENYLKSNERVETLCKNWGQKLNEESGICMIEICLECLGRFRRDCLESVHEACLQANHLKLDGDLPLLDNVEKKAVWLLSNIYQDKQMALDAQHILKMLWNAIFTKELTMFMTGKMSVARIFTAICLMEGDIEHVRVLLYQIAVCGFLNHWLFVVPVTSVWPEVLRKPLDVEMEKPHPTILVYEYLVTRSLLEQDTPSSRKVLKILEEMCNWSGCLESPEIVLRQLTTALYDMNLEEEPNKDHLFEVVQACKLLLKNESWSWCNDYFINRQGLQPAYNRYLCKKGTVASRYVCDVLKITRYIISCHSEHVKQREVNHICKTWILNMMSKEEGDPVVQNCCLETLLEISVLSPSIITEIHKWLQKHSNHSLDRHLQRLEIVRQAYKTRFGLICEPFTS